MIRTIVALLCMTVMSSFCFAHGNEQHVMGTVIKVSQESVTVETHTKATVEVMISSNTKFSKNGAPTAPSDLHVGDRVVIHAMFMKDGKLMAHTIQVGVAKTSAQSH
ncbi:MAG: DUF5666 domain-containing protein [Terriglobales bacterium]|jgi:hypothetical protein